MSLVVADPDVLWGTPVFNGTKIPAETLFDYLEDGESLDSFLRDFPNVSRETALSCLRLGKQMVIEREIGVLLR